jgi:hypothetical protein
VRDPLVALSGAAPPRASGSRRRRRGLPTRSAGSIASAPRSMASLPSGATANMPQATAPPCRRTRAAAAPTAWWAASATMRVRRSSLADARPLRRQGPAPSRRLHLEHPAARQAGADADRASWRERGRAARSRGGGLSAIGVYPACGGLGGLLTQPGLNSRSSSLFFLHRLPRASKALRGFAWLPWN